MTSSAPGHAPRQSSEAAIPRPQEFVQGAASLLVMTATITPPADAPGMNRMDPAVRLNDYLTALGHYLALIGTVIDGIVFVENSSSDVSALRQLAQDRGMSDKVEFLVFDGMDKPASYGRCYGEARILDFAMTHSQLVAASAPDAVVYKITGRYKLLNFSRLKRSRPARFDLYCDLRSARGHWADMRFMAWTRAGYERCLRGIAEEIREDTNNGRPGEETLFFALQRRMAGANVVTSYRREPLIDGVRGFDNVNWSQGRQRLVYLFRDLQRIFLRRIVA
jgi:hypothetical protein